MNALEKLVNQNNNDKFISVGLDTDFDKLPVHIKSSANPVLNFNKTIIDSTSEYWKKNRKREEINSVL